MISFVLQESSCRALAQSGGRIDTACDILHRQMEAAGHAIHASLNNHLESSVINGRVSAGLTARNVAAVNRSKPEYSNGHHVLHRASPAALNFTRSDSPAANSSISTPTTSSGTISTLVDQLA